MDVPRVTAPEHQDALLTLIEERTQLAGGELLALVEKVRRHLTEAWLTGTPLSAVELVALVHRLSEAMTVAATRADRPPIRDAVITELAYRKTRLRQFAAVLLHTERPSLGAMALVWAQPEKLVSGLRGIISDHEVGKANAAVLARFRRSPGKVAMWVPERDACVRCLRYSGLRLLRPGDRFPGGLSYLADAVPATAPATVASPPLHRRCRCELQLVARGDSEEASAALKREADRSILRGFAVESESQATRRAAAEKLLASGVNAPKSVKADARRRLQAGDTFTRPVPDGSGAP
jgi:hypothetical protein